MIQKTTKFSIIAFLLLFTVTSAYCVDFTRIGGGLAFSSGIENADHKTGNPGINARGVLELGEKFWLIPGLTFYLPGKRQGSTTFFYSFDVDATYALAKEKSILFYALAGVNLSYVSTKFDVRPKESNLLPGLNIGTGIEMIIEKDWTAFAQIKGVIGSYDQEVSAYIGINIGVHYYISGRRYKTW
jgi:hypothetical protein